jgi:hypothetical protein
MSSTAVRKPMAPAPTTRTLRAGAAATDIIVRHSVRTRNNKEWEVFLVVQPLLMVRLLCSTFQVADDHFFTAPFTAPHYSFFD